jgi:hypothetical protein
MYNNGVWIILGAQNVTSDGFYVPTALEQSVLVKEETWF